MNLMYTASFRPLKPGKAVSPCWLPYLRQHERSSGGDGLAGVLVRILQHVLILIKGTTRQRLDSRLFGRKPRVKTFNNSFLSKNYPWQQNEQETRKKETNNKIQLVAPVNYDKLVRWFA
jgi:hypothetical protein